MAVHGPISLGFQQIWYSSASRTGTNLQVVVYLRAPKRITTIVSAITTLCCVSR